jgi:hypothetical protein
MAKENSTADRDSIETSELLLGDQDWTGCTAVTIVQIDNVKHDSPIAELFNSF